MKKEQVNELLCDCMIELLTDNAIIERMVKDLNTDEDED